MTAGSGGDAASCSLVTDQLRALEEMPLLDLRSEWGRFCSSKPPRLSRDLLLRALAYRIQERAHGGLSRASLRLLKVDVGESGSVTTARASPAPVMKPGAKLVREWHGRSHVVSVTETGFDYAGASYRSLTEIAKLITGAHWSGPRFFGLQSRRAELRTGNG